MLILLTDGSGLTSRQVATQASAAGHRVEVVAPTRLGPAGFTRRVRRIHAVPPFGKDPEGWLEATLDVLRRGRHDVLLPTQEQVAILARECDRIHELGVALAVPPFASLVRVQDKVAQAETLEALGLPHPATTILHGPGYLKAPIGTASNAVRRFEGDLVVQQQIDGPLVMIQAVFDRGRLVAWHANQREREGANGGAAIKRSLEIPIVATHLVSLGDELAWHGALSLDAILTPGGPSYIDVNPRLVEPGNAWRAGTDLVQALLAVSKNEHPAAAPPSRPGVRTRQLLIGLLGQRRRRDVVRELARAARDDAAEELTPVRGDPRAAIPLLAAAAATLVSPRTARFFTDGAVTNYALTTEAWRRIRWQCGDDGAKLPPVDR